MSYKAFQSTIKRANVTMSEDECKDIVQAYRTNANRIADLWRQGDRLLKNLSRDTNKAYSEYGRRGVVKADIDSLILPNNMRIHYKNLHTILEESEWLDDDGNPTVKRQVVYVGRGDKIKYIYGGKLTENVVQALARIIIGEQMLLIAKKYQVVLTVHDAVACIVPIEEKDEAMKYVEECMNYTPDWAEGLPLTCELGNGNSYGGILK
jgi:DNA polymerase